MGTHVVCAADELPPGGRAVVDVNGKSICVFNVGGELYALQNSCPHAGGPLCAGTIEGTMLPSDPHTYVYGLHNRIIRCPWHGWEIDIATGRPRWTNAPGRARTYPAAIEDGHVVVKLR
jgi:nitrite reductase (NADH) small subunit